MADELTPTISVLMVTFNHYDYLPEALDSVLRQRTSRTLEIVIGDDCSTDGTQEILREYKRRFPHLIRCFFRSHNLGFQSNFIRTFRSCRGQFIALLDGDDYWVPEDKLEKQADVLDHYAECVICFGQSLEFFEHSNREARIFPTFEKRWFNLYDLLRCDFIPVCTAMFRYTRKLRFPSWISQMPMTDWVLWTLLAQRGQIYYLPEVLGAYRKHERGIWTRKTAVERTDAIQIFYSRIINILPKCYAQTIEESIHQLKRRTLRE